MNTERQRRKIKKIFSKICKFYQNFSIKVKIIECFVNTRQTLDTKVKTCYWNFYQIGRYHFSNGEDVLNFSKAEKIKKIKVYKDFFNFKEYLAKLRSI